MYDVIIIGGGPAGLTAAIYTVRRNLKTLILTKDIGGQITKTNEIENFPGFEKITGSELAMKMFNQAKKLGAEIRFDEVKKIEKKDKIFELATIKETISTKSIILAFGKKPRELGVPGEEELKGKGVSYCATCDAPFFKDRTLAVVGGGNSALDAAIISAEFAKKVYLIHRREEFRGEEVRIKKVKSTKSIELVLNSQIAKINGKDKVESITLSNGNEIKTDGVLVEVGFMIDRSLITGLVELDENNQVVIDTFQRTSVPGIFACGDLTETPFKQIIISAAEGAKAALTTYDYIQSLDGKKGIFADWH